MILKSNEPWTFEEEDILRAMWRQHYSAEYIAEELGRSFGSVKKKANLMGLSYNGLERYASDKTVSICLNCPKTKCRPNKCKLVAGIPTRTKIKGDTDNDD